MMKRTWAVVFFLWVWLFPFKKCEAVTLFSFQGHLDTRHRTFELFLNLNDGGSVSTQITPLADDHFQLKTKIEHLKTPLMEISTLLESSIKVHKAEGFLMHALKGTFDSQYSLINYKPVKELSGSFEITGGRLVLNSVSWGDVLAEGYVELLVPHEMNLRFRFSDMRWEDFFNFFGCPMENTPKSGFISGEIHLAGFPHNPLLKGRLISYEGWIEDLEYDNLVINFEGVYPVLKVFDSHVFQRNGLSFKIEGGLEIGGGCHTPLERLVKLKMSPWIDTTDVAHTWTIKRKQEEGSSSTTEFKYLLRKSLDKGTSFSSQDLDMLGIERSFKF